MQKQTFRINRTTSGLVLNTISLAPSKNVMFL